MDSTRLAAELIEYETVSPVTDPASLEHVAGRLSEHGIDATIHDVDGVKNLTAEIGGSPPRFCLNGHVDVVEPGEGWTVTDPFDPLVRDGRLYGRGATDMKGALAAQIAALVDLHHDDEFRAGVVLLVAGDEEVGGRRGTGALLDRYPDLEYALIGEPTGLDVQVGSRGTLWIDVFLDGTAAHASRPDATSGTALDDLPEVLEALQAFEPSGTLEGFPHPTAAVTVIETDTSQNTVPGSVRIGLDVRYLPGQRPAEIREELDRCLAPLDVAYRIETTDHGPPHRVTDETFVDTVKRVLADARGETVASLRTGGASDARFFTERGVPAVEVGVDREPAHRVDEFCETDQLDLLADVYARAIAELR